MMPPRSRITTLFAFVLALMIAACGTGPADVAVKVSKHMAAGEIDAVMPHLSSQFKVIGEDKLRAILQSMAAEAMKEGKLGGKTDIEVISEEIQGDFATVVLRIKDEEGDSREETFELVREDDQWKLTPGDTESK